MGEIFRSDSMNHLQLYIPFESSHDSLDELGRVGKIEFIDLNPNLNPFQRPFVQNIRRLEEMERRLKLIKSEKEQDLQLRKEKEIYQKESSSLFDEEEDFFDDLSEFEVEMRDDDRRGIIETTKIDELGIRLEEMERELEEMKKNWDIMKIKERELREKLELAKKSKSFFSDPTFGEPELDRNSSEDFGLLLNNSEPMMELTPASPSVSGTSNSTFQVVNYVTGTIVTEKIFSFERILWRTTRGNLYLKKSDLDTSESMEKKTAFIIFSHGTTLKRKIRKICETYGAQIYEIPPSEIERKKLIKELKNELQDLSQVKKRTEEHRRQVLRGGISQESGMGVEKVSLEKWSRDIKKEKSIYVILNLCQYSPGSQALIAEGWCPSKDIDRIQKALERGQQRSRSGVQPVVSIINRRTDVPPTSFSTNKFTSCFQGIVESYGVARYEEINPTVFTLITFPFLFGVMFGDVGHGIMLTLMSIYIIRNEKTLGRQKLNELLDTLYTGRYLLLLMGIFATYAGLLYNECFSIPINLFGSSWSLVNTTVDGVITDDQVYEMDSDKVYPFGVDPTWKSAANSLDYYNSLKMKLSVILGVSQMILGIVLSAFNATYFKKKYDLWYESVPQLIFMVSLFGYMCFLIIYKWFSPGPSAPYLLTVMINMALSPFSLAEEDKLFEGQGGIQGILIFVAFISVPWMLIPKPYFLKRDHENKGKHYGVLSESDEPRTEDTDESSDPEFDFSEIFVHQIIHTIEFVLGAISNTASYLRLWALSLAHAQLSEVFWEQIMVGSVNIGNFIAIFIAFSIWGVLTVGVLLIMECLSAFLHALRLHWVEFQNKFYRGDGKQFTPFSYQLILNSEDD